MDQALELFSRHAFKTISPPDKFKELSNRVIRYTGYLPLALKVLGSFFRGRVVDEWESALDRLAKTPNSEILGTLKLSFDGLEEFEKKIFLDVACFFKGRELDDVTRVLDSFDFCARIGVTSLVEKSLLTVTENRLDMHDLIQEMGWQVVRQSARDSRLRNYEEFHDIIMESKKLELVEAIVNMRERHWPNKLESIEAIVNPRERHWPKELEIIEVIMNWWGQSVFLKKGCCDDAFKSMKNLRLLHVYRNFTCHKPTFLPNGLRWLRWDEYPFSSLPLANTCKLVGLEMTFGDIKHLWEGQKKWAAKDGCISIAIPGSKIPSWFKEQQNGSKIALKLHFKWQTKIIGFAICGVIRQKFSSDFSCIKFIFENGGTLVPMLEVDCVNASTTAAVADDENENVWIGYVPLSLLQNMHHYDDDDFEGEDWYRIIQGNLIIELTSAYGKAIRCGAQVVYKEVESSQQVNKPSISSLYYWKWKLTRDRWSQNTIVFGE